MINETAAGHVGSDHIFKTVGEIVLEQKLAEAQAEIRALRAKLTNQDREERRINICGQPIRLVDVPAIQETLTVKETASVRAELEETGLVHVIGRNRCDNSIAFSHYINRLDLMDARSNIQVLGELHLRTLMGLAAELRKREQPSS